MKIYNLPRGAGKSTRLLYISEFTDTPILCVDEISKEALMSKASEANINIPEPYTVKDIIGFEKIVLERELLVDEPIMCLKEMIRRFCGETDIIAATLSEEDICKPKK